MPVIKPSFVEEDALERYQVRLNRVFDTPSSNRFPTILHENPDGTHSLHMEALPLFGGTIDVYARILANHEDEIGDGILYRNDSELCAIVMMAWYLVDEGASLPALYDKYDDYHEIGNFYCTSTAVWAVLGFFREMWDLRHSLADSVFMTYLSCFVHLIDVLRRHGINVVVAM
jgi:hypothetical protein